MSNILSLVGMAAKCHAIEKDLDVTSHAIIAEACRMVCEAAKAALGTYDFGWVPLKPETIASKVLGDSPLLETGALMNSISWTAAGNVGFVGSNSDIAVYQELGTSSIPPRSFLVSAAVHQEKEIVAMAAKAVRAVLRGEGLYGAEMRELMHVLHLLKSAAHQVGEMLAPENEDENKRGHR